MTFRKGFETYEKRNKSSDLLGVNGKIDKSDLNLNILFELLF